MIPTQPIARRLRKDAGVTLTELIIALAISSAVVAALLTVLATGATLFRDAEAGADAQSNLRFAADRLQKDLRVASLNATANAATDPDVAGQPSDPGNWIGLKRNADGIYNFGSGVAASNHGGSNTAFEVDSVTILGNYLNAERHIAAAVSSSGSVTLNQGEVDTQAEFEEMYKASSPVALHMRDGVYLGTVVSATWSSTAPTILMTPGPTSSTAQTGYGANESMLSPLRFIRYSIQYDPLDATKTDLVREEVNSDGSQASYSNRLVLAEYAVGLRFTFCKDTAFAYGTAATATSFTCNVGTVEPISTNPEQLRGVRVTAWVRTPTEANFSLPSWASTADMPEIGFNLSGDTKRIARVRKFEVAVEFANYGVK